LNHKEDKKLGGEGRGEMLKNKKIMPKYNN